MNKSYFVRAQTCQSNRGTATLYTQEADGTNRTLETTLAVQSSGEAVRTVGMACACGFATQASFSRRYAPYICTQVSAVILTPAMASSWVSY